MNKNMFLWFTIGLFLHSVVNGDVVKKEKLLAAKLPEIYQDVLVNGEVVIHGRRNCCEKRYEAIRELLDQFDRPIKVLDIGASQGYYSFKIASDYDASCIMIESNNAKYQAIKQLIPLNPQAKNLTLLKNKIGKKEVEYLLKNEKFDVVLALNVLYCINDSAWETLSKLGDLVIIECPQNAKKAYMFAQRGKFLLESETKIPNYWAMSHMFLFENCPLSQSKVKAPFARSSLVFLRNDFN